MASRLRALSDQQQESEQEGGVGVLASIAGLEHRSRRDG
jgi:hypothetical protein